MQRICFHLRVKRDCVDEYRERHRHVWPEMCEALRTSGWRNYSLFLDETGLLTGYLECDDFTQVRARMEAREVNARWQMEMAELIERGERPDHGMRPIEEVFHLD
jgi:L-rhamnose mutarotase